MFARDFFFQEFLLKVCLVVFRPNLSKFVSVSACTLYEFGTSAFSDSRVNTENDVKPSTRKDCCITRAYHPQHCHLEPVTLAAVARKGVQTKAEVWSHSHTCHSKATTLCCWWGTWSVVNLPCLTMWHDKFLILPSVHPRISFPPTPLPPALPF